MKTRHLVIAIVAAGFAVSASAQPPKTLNLKLPPGSVSAESANATSTHGASVASTAAGANAATTTSTDASSQPSPPNAIQPGVPYDASANVAVDAADSRTPARAAVACDDSAYNDPQVHGSVGMGVVAGNHISGNYQSGVVNVTKKLGSCDNPTGDVSLTVSVNRGDFNNSRRRRGPR